MTRKERRLEAKRNKTAFVPQYNSGVRFSKYGEKIIVGGEPKTYKESYGIGYERFNNKFITIAEEEVKNEKE